MYVRPEIKGEVTSFGVSGKLWRDSLVMYDRGTNSLWSQLLGEAVAGPMKGRKLEQLPAEVTTWSAWRERHPDTLVLRKPGVEAFADARRRGSSYYAYHADPHAIGVNGTRNPDGRLPGKTLVYGIALDGGYAAVPFALLEKMPVLNTEAVGRPVVVFSPQGESAALAYERTVDGKELVFDVVRDADGRLTVRDVATGSTWSWETGECLQGAFAGKSLQRIVGSTVYWGVWAQFHPESEVILSGF